MAQHTDPNPIAGLSFIGDQKTVCAIGADGSLPLMSFPNIDEPTLFSRALSGTEGSALSLRTSATSTAANQTLVAGTNRVVTHFAESDKRWTVMDMMVPGTASLLVRQITAVVGNVTVDATIAPAPDYEREAPVLEPRGPRAVALTNGTDIVFSASTDLAVQNGTVTGSFTLREGESGWLTIGETAQTDLDIDALVAKTDAFWRTFLVPMKDEVPYPTLMARQALSAGLLHNAHGDSVLAAGTFGFPEAVGGERNWDYRFVWVRDSAVGAKALARLGFTALAEQWLRFVMLDNTSCDRSPLELMLSTKGEVVDSETMLDHFDGMLGAQPVRVGNDASGQLQLDIFGELAFALRAMCEADATPDDALLDKMRDLLGWLADNWNKPDSSIWELRGKEKHYLFSRLMCWVAFRDAQAIFAHCGRPVDPAWADLEREIADNIHANFWCPTTQSYMQTADCTVVDAAVIAMRLFGYLEADDERWQKSKAEIRKSLVKPQGVLRYPHHAKDGFDSEDGTFVLCTCWWIEALWMDGDHAEARTIFDELRLRFDDGQMSEEVGEDDRLLGNMPQLFSHAGLIEAALRIGEPT